MPRKQPAADPDAGAWRVILEDIQAQFRVFGDALNSSIHGLRREVVERFERTDRRLDALEGAVRQNSADIRQNSADIRQNSTDIRDLTSRVEKLEGIEERVTALEQRRS